MCTCASSCTCNPSKKQLRHKELTWVFLASTVLYCTFGAPELNELKARSARMLIQKAKLTWIAFGGPSLQSHKLPKLLVILKNVPRGMLVSLRDFRTWISASDPESQPQPESFAGKGKRLLMQHLLQDDVQLHSSCSAQIRLLLIRWETSTVDLCFVQFQACTN